MKRKELTSTVGLLSYGYILGKEGMVESDMNLNSWLKGNKDFSSCKGKVMDSNDFTGLGYRCYESDW